MVRSLVRSLLVVALLAAPSAASARKTHEFAYRYEQVWGAAIRLIRVDYGFNVRDRDEEIGFLLFDYSDGTRTYPGSLELLRSVQDGQEKIRVVMQIPSMPGYVEQMVLDRLGRKLLTDFGEPLRPVASAPPEPPASDAPAEDPEREGGEGEAPAEPPSSPSRSGRR